MWTLLLRGSLKILLVEPLSLDLFSLFVPPISPSLLALSLSRSLLFSLNLSRSLAPSVFSSLATNTQQGEAAQGESEISVCRCQSGSAIQALLQRHIITTYSSGSFWFCRSRTLGASATPTASETLGGASPSSRYSHVELARPSGT